VVWLRSALKLNSFDQLTAIFAKFHAFWPRTLPCLHTWLHSLPSEAATDNTGRNPKLLATDFFSGDSSDEDLIGSAFRQRTVEDAANRATVSDDHF